MALSEIGDLSKDERLINLVYSHVVLEFQDEEGMLARSLAIV